jgi:hypothetical protein
MDTPQLDDTLFFLGQIGAALIAIGGGLAIIHRLFFKKLCDRLDKIDQELHPNGGSSLRDAVNRIEQNQVEIKEDAKDIRNKIDDHIEWHLNN